ncbi:hypothetical protein IW138_005115, partial [Coemansia sp. RSA 986]
MVSTPMARKVGTTPPTAATDEAYQKLLERHSELAKKLHGHEPVLELLELLEHLGVVEEHEVYLNSAHGVFDRMARHVLSFAKKKLMPPSSEMKLIDTEQTGEQ